MGWIVSERAQLSKRCPFASAREYTPRLDSSTRASLLCGGP